MNTSKCAWALTENEQDKSSGAHQNDPEWYGRMKTEQQKVCSNTFLAIRLHIKQRILSHFVQITQTPFSMTWLIIEKYFYGCGKPGAAHRTAGLLTEADLLRAGKIFSSEQIKENEKNRTTWKGSRECWICRIKSRCSLTCLVSRKLKYEALNTIERFSKNKSEGQITSR